MFNTTRRDYIDYKLYGVTKLKNKYGFRVKLIFSDGTKDTKQIGGFLKKLRQIRKEIKWLLN